MPGIRQIFRVLVLYACYYKTSGHFFYVWTTIGHLTFVYNQKYKAKEGLLTGA